MKGFWYWILSLFRKEYEVTVYFDGDTVTNIDGSKITNRAPKTYVCKSIQKMSPKHIKLILQDDSLVEIKTITPVGHDIVTRKFQRPS